MVGQGPTISQLRNKIDKGLAGSKIDVIDPAAAPLGTDDEAAGTPPSAERVEIAMREEIERKPSSAKQSGMDAGVAIYLSIMAVIVAVICVMGIVLL